MSGNTMPRGLTGQRATGVQTDHKGRPVAIASIIVFTVALAVGIIAPTELEVPARDSSTSALFHILRSNLTLIAALGACAGLQHFSRKEVLEGKKPWIRRTTDLALGLFLAMNISVVGFAIGQLGGDALIRILPHAWLEVPAFALGVWGYLLARQGDLTTNKAAAIYGSAFLMIVLAAPIETYVSGSI